MSHIISLVTLFLVISEVLLVAFYWQEILNRNNAQTSFMFQKYKVPFFVILSFWWLIGFIMMICLILNQISIAYLLWFISFFSAQIVCAYLFKCLVFHHKIFYIHWCADYSSIEPK